MDALLARSSKSFLTLALVGTWGVLSLAAAAASTSLDWQDAAAEKTSIVFVSDTSPAKSPGESADQAPALPKAGARATLVVRGKPAPGPQLVTNPSAFVPVDDAAEHPDQVEHAAQAEHALQMASDRPQKKSKSKKSKLSAATLSSDAALSSPQALSAGRPEAKQQPLVALAQSSASKNLQKVSISEPVQVPAEQPQSSKVQVAVHSEPLESLELVPPQPEPDSLESLLVSAHAISQRAESLQDYTQIIKQCAAAMRLGAQADQGQFARQLRSWALNRRGQLFAEQGDSVSAGADFQAALEMSPRNWRAMHNRGVSHAQAGQLAEAFDDFNMVTQLNPHYAKAFANRATLYVEAKDLQAAMHDYRQALECDPKLVNAHLGLGRACHQLGRWEQAIAHFDKAVQLDPESPATVCSRGDLYADMGRYGEALADYAQAIELDPEFAHAYRNGAWLLATCPDPQYRDPENAILGAKQALEYSYGDRHVSLDTLAAALASSGQFTAAIDALTEAVDLAPAGAASAYLARLELYQSHQPFLNEVVGGQVAQAAYEAEASDR